jgi:acyl dehydratase
MPISETHAGRSYPPTEPYEVSAAKIAEFATALGDDNPAYRGAEPVAPPTFVAVVSATAWESMFADAELDLALRRLVHGDQRFSYARPLRAGDVITATLTIDRVRVRAGSEIVSCSVMIKTVDGQEICTAASTFFHSREAAS